MARFRTPVAIASFPQVFKPKSFNNQAPKYSITLIFDKAAQATPEFKALKEGIEATAKEKWPSGIPQKNWSWPWKKGEEMISEKGARYAGCDDGTIVMKATSGADFPPDILDKDKQPMKDEKLLYAGAKVMAMLTPKAFDVSGNKGVNLYLNSLLKVGEGKRLSGSAQDDFKDAEVEIEDVDFG